VLNDATTRVTGLCRDCIFWDNLVPDEMKMESEVLARGTGGLCRRRAPENVQSLDPASVPPTVVSAIRPAVFPITRGQDWCGEHPLRQVYADLELEEYRGKAREQFREAKRVLREQARADARAPQQGRDS
jgi:hypothetical protein